MVQIERIELVVGDLDRAQRFYVEALGFTVVPEASGTAANGIRRAALRLGTTRLDLLAYDTRGAAYPATRAANDPWFQHFAIAVSDMPAAYARLSQYAPEPISIGGPQLLPPSTGSVTAYKFRDLDGHPLELSFNPAAPHVPMALFTGIDHSAIAVADVEASVAFYTGLGFHVAERLVNTGPAQDRLDGLSGVVLDIIVLTAAAGPHRELLHYRSPLPGMGATVAAQDVAATRLVLSGKGDQGIRRDPDGHYVEVVTAGS